MIFCILLCLVSFRPGWANEFPWSKKQIKILPLGDSITQSGYWYCGYRYSLWQEMIDNHLNVDFIGSMHNLYKPYQQDMCQPYKGISFDNDHEGHWGWETDHILGKTRLDLPGSGDGNLKIWLKGYKPDIVLIFLGHNDIDHKKSIDHTIDNLTEIINLLRGNNPNVTILMAQIYPTFMVSLNPAIAGLNQRIKVLADAMTTTKSRIMAIDMSTGFHTLTDAFDGLHLNDSGGSKIARKWFSGLKQVMNVK